VPEYVSYDDKRQLVLVNSAGKTTIEDWRRSARTISQLIQRFNTDGVLIDVRKQSEGPDYRTVFNFGTNLLNLSGFLNAKFAILVVNFSEIHDLLIRTTTSRGLNFRIFDCKHKASTGSDSLLKLK
jgi:hypothetical protein